MSKENNPADFSDFPEIGGVIASKMITEGGKRPQFMYRDKPSDEYDSGWVLFAGCEPEDFVEDPENFGVYDPETLIAIDPSLAGLLLKGIGSVFEREEETADWERIDDYPMESDFMLSEQLSENWVWEINNLFIQSDDDDSRMYTTGDKTVRLDLFEMNGKSREGFCGEFLKEIETRDQSRSKTLQTFDLSDDDVSRLGYMIKESDGEKEYNLICGFCVSNESILFSVFYFDDEKDLPWALATWKSIKKA